jgi:gliding motility-associated-like protein
MFKRIIIYIAIFLLALQVQAQYVPIPDTAFANVLKEIKPDLVSADGTLLDTIEAKLYSGGINFKDRGTVVDLEGVQYFINATLINGVNNQIEHIPDLSRQTKLRTLNVIGNKITSLTGVEHMKELIHLYVSMNQLTEFSGYDKLPNLKNVQIGSNYLKTLYVPEYNGVLDVFGLDFNLFTWEEINKILDYPGQDTIFDPFSQQEVTNDSVVVLKENETFRIEYPYDQNVTGLRFIVQKNNSDNIRVNDNPVFEIEHVSFADSGIYEIFARTDIPAWGNRGIVTGETKLRVKPCQIIESYSFSDVEVCPEVNVTLDEITLNNTDVPFSIYLENTENLFLTEFYTGQSNVLDDGIYNLVVTDGDMCEKRIDSVITVSLTPECKSCDSLKQLVRADTSLSFVEYDTVTLSLPQFEVISNLSFSWEYNGREIEKENESEVTLTTIALADSGLYSANIGCELKDGSLYDFKSRVFDISTIPFQEVINYGISALEYCDSLVVILDSINVTRQEIALSYYLVEKTINILYPIDTGKSIILPEGDYDLKVTNESFYTEVISDVLSVSIPTDCKTCDSLQALNFADVAVSVFEHDTVTFELTDLVAEPLLSFQWKKGEELLENTPSFLMEGVSLSDAGIYTNTFTCALPLGQSIDFQSQGFTLEVKPYQTVSNVEFSVVETCDEISLTLENISLTNTRDDFQLFVKNTISGDLFAIEKNSKSLVSAGSYDLIVTNGSFYSDTLKNAVTVTEPISCEQCNSYASKVLSDTLIEAREFDTIQFSLPHFQSINELEYQWFFNGVKISGATESILLLNNVELADKGRYHAIVYCPLAGDDTLEIQTRTFELSLIDYQNISDYSVSKEEFCTSLTVQLDVLELANTDDSFEIYLEHDVTKTLQPIAVGQAVEVEEGVYNLVVRNALYEEIISTVISVVTPNQCQYCDSLVTLPKVDSTLSVFEQADLTLKVPSDFPIENVTITWFFNGSEIPNSNQSSISISSATKENAGEYSAQISCKTVNDETVETTVITYTLEVLDYQTVGSFDFVKNIDCEAIKVTLTEIELANNSEVFEVQLISIDGSANISLSLEETVELTPGSYDLIVTDNAQYKHVEPMAFTVNYPANCSAIFSPNGDGVNDTWYIESDFPVTIVNKAGKVVKTSDSSFIWDGTDNDGQDLPMGVYSIVFSESTFQKITLVR